MIATENQRTAINKVLEGFSAYTRQEAMEMAFAVLDVPDGDLGSYVRWCGIENMSADFLREFLGECDAIDG